MPKIRQRLGLDWNKVFILLVFGFSMLGAVLVIFSVYWLYQILSEVK